MKIRHILLVLLLLALPPTLAQEESTVHTVTFENHPFGGEAYILSDFTGFPASVTPIPGMNTVRYGQAGALYVFWGPTGLRISE